VSLGEIDHFEMGCSILDVKEDGARNSMSACFHQERSRKSAAVSVDPEGLRLHIEEEFSTKIPFQLLVSRERFGWS
jgi:hypothetical protein